MTKRWHPDNEDGLESTREAEETLHLLAKLPAPDGLSERVHRRLVAAKAVPERRGFWSFWSPSQRLQFAAASVLAVAVAGSTWSVYHLHPQKLTPAGAGGPVAAPQVSVPGAGGGFGSAGAERVPPTLNPIKVPPAPKKKPSASRVIAKPSPKKLAAPFAYGEPKSPADQ